MGGDAVRGCGLPLHSGFNPRPYMGGDPPRTRTSASRRWFQSTPLHGGRRTELEQIPHCHVFQSTPLHGGRPLLGVTSVASICFNPRPYMGGDAVSLSQYLRRGVSIHAPTWGAPFGSEHTTAGIVVSIHAPTWGATIYVTTSLIRGRYESISANHPLYTFMQLGQIVCFPLCPSLSTGANPYKNMYHILFALYDDSLIHIV